MSRPELNPIVGLLLLLLLTLTAVSSACPWSLQNCSFSENVCTAHLQRECPCAQQTCLELANRTRAAAKPFCDSNCNERPQWGAWGPWVHLECRRRRSRVCLKAANASGSCEFSFGPVQGQATPCKKSESQGVNVLTLILYSLPPLFIGLVLAITYCIRICRVHHIRRRTKRHSLRQLVMRMSLDMHHFYTLSASTSASNSPFSTVTTLGMEAQDVERETAAVREKNVSSA